MSCAGITRNAGICHKWRKCKRSPMIELNILSKASNAGVSDTVAETKQAGIPRAAEMILSLVALVLFAPFIAFSALLILLTSGRPVFFRQSRVGLRGRHFSLCKLRTMQ